MKRLIAQSALLASISAFCIAGSAFAETDDTDQVKGPGMTRIQFIVGDAILPATLDDTPAARDFASLLPLELTLGDYGVEKTADLPRKLDTSGAPASYKPEKGDITQYVPWSNIAIFLEPFSNSRGLLRLGAFDGPMGALERSGDIPVRIEIAD